MFRLLPLCMQLDRDKQPKHKGVRPVAVVPQRFRECIMNGITVHQASLGLSGSTLYKGKWMDDGVPCASRLPFVTRSNAQAHSLQSSMAGANVAS